MNFYNNSQLVSWLSRRELLQRSGLGVGSLALTGLLADGGEISAAPARREKSVSPLLASAPHHQPRAKRIIHLFMNGGPSQFDTFYPKPELQRLDGQPLPDSIKNKLQPTQRNRVGLLFGSPFKFRKYGESGLTVSELFPNVAQHADELCVLRSMQGEIANHTPGLLLTNCGHSTLPRPSLGSWMLYGLGLHLRLRIIVHKRK